MAIEQQSAKHPNQVWQVMDATNMSFEADSFPAVVDKSLIDTLLCCKDRYILNEISPFQPAKMHLYPPPYLSECMSSSSFICSAAKVSAMLSEIHRVLVPGGRYITFSLHGVEEVLPRFDSSLWHVHAYRYQQLLVLILILVLLDID